MMTMICTPRQVTWITAVIRAGMWYEACDTDGVEEGLSEKPEGRSPLARPRQRWGIILKLALQNRVKVNWINAHAAPVFAGSVLLCRKPEDGYWESHGEALC